MFSPFLALSPDLEYQSRHLAHADTRTIWDLWRGSRGHEEGLRTWVLD